MNRIFVKIAKQTLVVLALVGMASQTLTSGVPEGTRSFMAKTTVSHERGDGTNRYGKTSLTKTTTYKDAQGKDLTSETLQANRFFVKTKNLLNEKPVASFFYGQAAELPTAHHKITFSGENYVGFKKDFEKKQRRTFIEQSKDLSLQALKQLTQNLSKPVSFLLEFPNPQENVFVEVEKVLESFVGMRKFFVNKELHQHAVVRITIYGTTPQAPQPIVNLFEALLADTPWSTGIEINQTAKTVVPSVILTGYFIGLAYQEHKSAQRRQQSEGINIDFRAQDLSQDLAQKIKAKNSSLNIFYTTEKDASSSDFAYPQTNNDGNEINLILESALYDPRDIDAKTKQSDRTPLVTAAINRALLHDNIVHPAKDKIILFYASNLEKISKEQYTSLAEKGWILGILNDLKFHRIIPIELWDVILVKNNGFRVNLKDVDIKEILAVTSHPLADKIIDELIATKRIAL